MRFTTLFFDLDDTLYPNSSGLWQAIKERINIYMVERLGISESDSPALREQYFKMYGTTLRGLQARHNVNVEDYLAFVHDLPLQDFLAPNPIQRDAIASLPQRKLIFTNADANHARRVLAALQLDDLFDSIIDVQAVAPYCKPMPESFAIAQDLADEPDPRKCVMIDDLPRTTRAALETGMASILYGVNEPTADASGVFTDWSHLPILLE
ncbi:MAG: pyrimidine 5'-nucleotidase [Anaerolineaceae bacterium]|jgi:pyrimidine 5'-nucleotidase|nr:pyrimidine 5'-nucleotidase [Anaerolineaceae bacterium]OQY88973.1 MAG: pyrimidine 5'-nucleotidase [Anaerolineae bacterium UTCFX1]